MITKIEIDGFKSFKGFEMTLTPFTVIAGLNASGKSNLFDALELLSRLATMSLRDAFPERRGSVVELFTLIDGDLHQTDMKFAVELLVARTVKDNWGQTAEIKSPRLRYELHIARRKNVHGFEELFVTHEQLSKIPTSDDTWVKKYIAKNATQLWKVEQGGGSGKPFIETALHEGVSTITLRQDGRQGRKATPADAIHQTVLAGVNSADFPHVFAAKEEMRSWRFMQLSPDELRKPTMQHPGMNYTITHSGANLASALFRLKAHDPELLTDISRQLMRFLPEFVGVDVLNDEANKQFVVQLRHKDGKTFTSRVLSEGTLRILALIIMQHDPEHTGLLCFEEPENGVHPMRIAQMVELLSGLSSGLDDAQPQLRQVIVNTHSPLLVRYMSKLHDTHTTSVWLSKMATLITTYAGNRVQLRCSAVNQVAMSPQPSLAGQQLNTADLAQYLATLNDHQQETPLSLAS